MASCNECFNIIDENYAYLKMFCNDKCYSDFQEKGGEISKCPKCNSFEAVTKDEKRNRSGRTKETLNYCTKCRGQYLVDKYKEEKLLKKEIRLEKRLANQTSLYKKCGRCKEEKLKTLFGESNTRDGLRRYCKECDIQKEQSQKDRTQREKIKFYKDLQKANENIALEKRRVNILNPYTASIK